MTEIIKGINTAAITHENRFMAIAVKIRTPQGDDALYYMQNVVIRDVLLIMNNKFRAVVENMKLQGEAYKAQLVADNQALLKNLPAIQQQELQNPDPARRVMSVALKQESEHFTLIAALQSGHVDIINFSNNQAEFVIHAITQALQNAGDKEAFIHFCGALDYIPLYDTGFSNINELDYQQYPHEAWRQALFPNYVGILFNYQTAEGDKILRGAVVKTYLKAESPEIQSIAGRMVNLLPHYKALQEQHQLKQIFCRDIQATSDQPLSTEQCLRPLRDYYLEMTAKLQNGEKR